MRNKKEFCKCKEPEYLCSAMPDRIYSCGICFNPIEWDQCIDKIETDIGLDEILSEAKSFLMP